MTTPQLTYTFYRDTYHGSLDEMRFEPTLVKAQARLIRLTGRDIPDVHREKWLLALCAICDRVAGIDRAGRIKSERVGSVSLTYTDAVAASTDYDAALDFLAGTGLLYRGLP